MLTAKLTILFVGGGMILQKRIGYYYTSAYLSVQAKGSVNLITNLFYNDTNTHNKILLFENYIHAYIEVKINTLNQS